MASIWTLEELADAIPTPPTARTRGSRDAAASRIAFR